MTCSSHFTLPVHLFAASCDALVSVLTGKWVNFNSSITTGFGRKYINSKWIHLNIGISTGLEKTHQFFKDADSW